MENWKIVSEMDFELGEFYEVNTISNCGKYWAKLLVYVVDYFPDVNSWKIDLVSMLDGSEHVLQGYKEASL